MKNSFDLGSQLLDGPVKWVVISVIAAGLLFAFISMSSDRNRCSELCVEKGYSGFRYTPARRSDSAARCYCLTKEEVEITNKIPPGTRVF